MTKFKDIILSEVTGKDMESDLGQFHDAYRYTKPTIYDLWNDVAMPLQRIVQAYLLDFL